MSWWLVIVLFLAVAIIWWWRARFIKGVTADQLLGRISDFIGYAGFASVLDVEVEHSQPVIQLAMRGDPQQRPELEFGVPDVSWSRSHFDALISTLERDGYPVQVELAPKQGLPVARWLVVKLKYPRDELAPRAHQLILTTFRSLSVPASSTFRIRHRGTIGPQAFAALGRSRNAA